MADNFCFSPPPPPPPPSSENGTVSQTVVLNVFQLLVLNLLLENILKTEFDFTLLFYD